MWTLLAQIDIAQVVLGVDMAGIDLQNGQIRLASRFVAPDAPIHLSQPEARCGIAGVEHDSRFQVQ